MIGIEAVNLFGHYRSNEGIPLPTWAITGLEPSDQRKSGANQGAASVDSHRQQTTTIIRFFLQQHSSNFLQNFCGLVACEPEPNAEMILALED